MVDLVALERIAREEYADIVMDAYRVDAKLRVLLIDDSYLDFWWSEVEQGRFAHHWNRQHVDGTIHRHDNSPIASGTISKPSRSIITENAKMRSAQASFQKSRVRLCELSDIVSRGHACRRNVRSRFALIAPKRKLSRQGVFPSTWLISRNDQRLVHPVDVIW